jgi:hypothetical protein
VFIIPSTSCNKFVRFASAAKYRVGGGSISKLKGGSVLGCGRVAGAYDIFVGVWISGEWNIIGISAPSSSSDSSWHVERGTRSEFRGEGIESGGGRGGKRLVC